MLQVSEKTQKRKCMWPEGERMGSLAFTSTFEEGEARFGGLESRGEHGATHEWAL